MPPVRHLRFFKQMTDKIVLKEFDLTHEKAKQMGIDHSPTLVFDPDRYNVRWLGAPLGEEGRIFLEVLLRIGTGKSDLNEAAMGC
jgi:thioredoxin reductase (NADPH)